MRHNITKYAFAVFLASMALLQGCAYPGMGGNQILFGTPTQKSYYVPLSLQIMQDIVNALPTCGPIRYVTVSLRNATGDETQVANNIVELLGRANIPGKTTGARHTLGKRESKVVITMNQRTEPTAMKLTEVLQKYLKVAFQGQYADLEDGVIKITIFGKFAFNPDGTAYMVSAPRGK